jgi:hypothetical protein
MDIEFIEKYVYGSSIMEIVYNTSQGKWIIRYAYALKDDTFETLQELMDFIVMDALSDE